MKDSKERFYFIAEKLSQEFDVVEQGKMMSFGIKYKTIIFAFHDKDLMVFRLGKGFAPATMGINEYSLLSPFPYTPVSNDPPITVSIHQSTCQHFSCF